MAIVTSRGFACPEDYASHSAMPGSLQARYFYTEIFISLAARVEPEHEEWRTSATCPSAARWVFTDVNRRSTSQSIGKRIIGRAGND